MDLDLWYCLEEKNCVLQSKKYGTTKAVRYYMCCGGFFNTFRTFADIKVMFISEVIADIKFPISEKKSPEIHFQNYFLVVFNAKQ